MLGKQTNNITLNGTRFYFNRKWFFILFISYCSNSLSSSPTHFATFFTKVYVRYFSSVFILLCKKLESKCCVVWFFSSSRVIFVLNFFFKFVQSEQRQQQQKKCTITCYTFSLICSQMRWIWHFPKNFAVHWELKRAKKNNFMKISD